MNPWDALWVLIGWIFYIFVFAGAALIILAALLGVWLEIAKRFSGRKPKPDEETLEAFTKEVANVSKRIYRDEVLMQEEQIKAFELGARWAWGFQHREK